MRLCANRVALTSALEGARILVKVDALRAVQKHALMSAWTLAVEIAAACVVLCVKLFVPDVLISANKDFICFGMKKTLYIIVSTLLFAGVISAQEPQDSAVLENRFYNPIYTADFARSSYPVLVLYVHSSHGETCKCPSSRMQKALETDSLGLRKTNNIKLYVVYPSDHKSADIDLFDSYKPQNAMLAFDINRLYGNIKRYPYVIFYDGKGGRWTQEGGTYSSLKESIEQWLTINQ